LRSVLDYETLSSNRRRHPEGMKATASSGHRAMMRPNPDEDCNMEAFVEEVINETMGTSHRKWALLLVAMLVGAVGALWLTRRTGGTEPATAPAEIEPAQ
jgi:hypothetical protein